MEERKERTMPLPEPISMQSGALEEKDGEARKEASASRASRRMKRVLGWFVDFSKVCFRQVC